MFDTRKWENLHIPLWLLKDTCWMLEYRYLGVLMILPTMAVAFYLLYKTFTTAEFYINLAICFWILANSYWMCSEFFDFIEYKLLAGIPFGLGLIAVTVYFIKKTNILKIRD